MCFFFVCCCCCAAASYQLRAILWKNWLVKWAHPWSTLAEVLLPVAFMALLIAIKGITTKYDSPTIAYYCGQTYPWFYSSNFSLSDPTAFHPFQCLIQPTTCTTNHYYTDGQSFSQLPGETTYIEYGYSNTPASNGKAYYPFYAFTIADQSNAALSQQGLEIPSLPFCDMIARINSAGSILAIAPEASSLTTAAQNLFTSLKGSCTNGTSSIVYFNSSDDLTNYATNSNYDNIGYGQGKIAFGIVLNNADVATGQWDYTIRVNYTTTYNQGDPTVACLYGGGCNFQYTIPSTYSYNNFDLYRPQLTDYVYGYAYTGFLTLQETMDKYIFSFYSATPTNVRASVGFMPIHNFKSDDFQYVISNVLGIFYMLSFLYPVSRLIRALVIEKEFRIKEGMKMMGLTDSVYNSSWFITAIIEFTVISILITLETSTTVFEYSNKLLVFVFFEAFAFAIINMCFLLATLFSKSKTAALLGPMIFFVTFFPYYAVSGVQYSESSKVATCLLAPSCFALGADVFANYEGDLVGVRPDNAAQNTGNFNYNACVGMMFADGVIYGLLAWYLDKVIPSEFGTSLPFYFFLMPSYWCGVHCCAAKDHAHAHEDQQKTGFFSSDGYKKVVIPKDAAGAGDVEAQRNAHLRYFEQIPPDLQQQVAEEKCVHIVDLTKIFYQTGQPDKIAVNHLNMDMFQNQVTVLLGHNGAGKTTAISMLVGMIPPTSGHAIMPGGLDITRDMAEIRRNLGVCPQHDILFPELTVFQHLQVFAAFKGVRPGAVYEESKKMLAEVGLQEKIHARSTALSGGQKRKLSLGIALIGDSKVVILDEPTSGMDPFSRRSTWNIIQRNKRGRVILLTTHFLDEADKLGDRVAIMAHGKLMCSGSPLFLKNQFGVGYTLTIVKLPMERTEHGKIMEVSAKIKALVLEFIPDAEPLSDVGNEQSFRLPFSASHVFVKLFEALDARKEELHIAEYGISVTTLEEVFLRVADIEEEEQMHEAVHTKAGSFHDPKALPVAAPVNGVEAGGENDPNTNKNVGAGPAVATGAAAVGAGALVASEVNNNPDAHNNPNDLKDASDTGKDGYVSNKDKFSPDEEKNQFSKHFVAMSIKRAIYGKRDVRMIICQLVLPIILVVIGLSVLLLQPNNNQPSLTLSASKFNPTFPPSQRNYVPIQVDGTCATCDSMQSRWNGASGDGVYGVAVPITTDTADAFGTCAQGAAPLHNMSSYLINTPQDDLNKEHGSTVYGSVTLDSGTNAANLIYNVLVNNSAVHSSGIFVNQVHQSYLQVLSGLPSAVITARNHPLPQTFKQQNQSQTANAFVVALFWIIAFCFIPASFAVFIVKEREFKSKHQQIISGANIYAYWLSTYCWDILSYLPTAALLIGILYAYNISAFTQGPASGAVVGLLLLYGPAAAGQTYIMSYLFKSHSTAQLVIMFFNFVTGLCLMVVSFVLTLLPSTSKKSVIVRYFFRIFPTFCLGDGILQLTLCVNGRECPTVGSNGYNFLQTEAPTAWNTAGADIVFLAVESVVYIGITLLIEYSLTFPQLNAWLYKVQDPGIKPGELEDEDIDVKEERKRVDAGGANEDIIKLHELRKVYPAHGAGGLSTMLLPADPNKVKVAVQSLSFGVPKGQCFGFLGINGAGKSTTLSILSGEFPPTSGEAFVDTYSIASDQTKIRRKIGYCPQFDALLELLTVREHLELYGRIKGFHGETLEEIVVGKLNQLQLTEFEHRLSSNLSGGNKRKLSVAIATIGEPPIVFLDEPSTGMDPKARRFMWKVISRMSTQDARCSVILTTHSMEEAEALCTRVGIMVNGRLRCLGSTQHLKYRFGNGFEVNIKTMTPSDDEMIALLRTIQSQMHLPSPTASTKLAIQQKAKKNAASNIPAEEMDELDALRISQQQFPQIGQILGNPERMQYEIAPFKAGNLIYEAMQAERSVTARLLLSWWISEDLFARLQVFMRDEFGDRGQLLERSSGQSCLFRIKKLDVTEAHNTSVKPTPAASKKAPVAPQANTSGKMMITSANSSAKEGRSVVGDNQVIPIVHGNAATEESKREEEDFPENWSNPLIEIFAKLERKKEYLHVQEYSVCETTLEQIFNQFASQHDNPEVAAMLANDQRQHNQWAQQYQQAASQRPPGANEAPEYRGPVVQRQPDQRGIEMSKV